MKKNIDKAGRIMRGAIGVLLLFVAYWKMSWIALLCGVFILFESLMSWCLFYQIIGKNACSPRNHKS